jgi:outer membrane protein
VLRVRRAPVASLLLAAAAVSATAGAQAPVRPPVGAAAPAAPGALDLTLDEAVALALEHNLDIAVERLNPQTFDLQIAGVRALYRPVLTSIVGQNNVTQLPTNQLVGTQAVQNDQTTFNFGGTQLLPWGGGNFTLGFNNRRQDSTSSFNTFNPQYNSTFSALFVQPLLRNFRTDATRTQLRITAINRDVSELQLRATITNTLADVRSAYWDYVYAVDQLQVARRSLELARKLLEDNRIRVEVGTLAPIDVVQAEAEVASRLQEEAQGEAQARTAELSLKRLIVSGTDDPLWRSSITPVDRPEFRSEPIDVESAVRKALSSRTDLDQARKTLDSNDITMKFLRNQTLPALDAVANYGAAGLGGTRFERGGLGSTQVLNSFPGGYGDAWRTLTGRDYPNWNFQVNFSYPLGGSAADAVYARSRVQRNQTAAQLKALELQVATDVTNAALQVESSLKSYEAATVARSLAETRLSAEQSRFEVGLSTNFFVVQAQRDLATAQNSELRALLNYRRAIVDYGRVQEAPATRGANSITAVTAGAGGN